MQPRLGNAVVRPFEPDETLNGATVPRDLRSKRNASLDVISEHAGRTLEADRR